MKNKFIFATLIATVAMTSVAFAGHWKLNDNNEWRYYTNSGDVVTNEWAESQGAFYYLDSNGSIVTDSMVDDEYYVDSNGVRVKDQWIKHENNWYYFGTNGKMYKTDKGELNVSNLKEINGKKYAFDADGKMLYGWIDASSVAMVDEDDEEGWKNAVYYAGSAEDGAITTGWRQITVEDDDETKNYWFFFQNNGKKSTNEKKTINGVTYKFNTEDGHMISEWDIASGSSATSSNLNFMKGTGAMVKKGWIWAVPDEDYIPEDYNDDEYSWWYAENSGKIVKNTVKKVNGKYYAFDDMGRMLYGLVTIDGGDYTMKNGDKDITDLTSEQIKALDVDKLYFFSGSEDDGSRKTGNVKITLDDDTFDFYFNKNGEAENGYVSKIKKYCVNGLIIKADKGESNMGAFDADYKLHYNGDIEEGMILVNTTGSVLKNKKNIKSNDDYYFCTDADGVVTYVGTEKKKNV